MYKYIQFVTDEHSTDSIYSRFDNIIAKTVCLCRIYESSYGPIRLPTLLLNIKKVQFCFHTDLLT